MSINQNEKVYKSVEEIKEILYRLNNVKVNARKEQLALDYNKTFFKLILLHKELENIKEEIKVTDIEAYNTALNIVGLNLDNVSIDVLINNTMEWLSDVYSMEDLTKDDNDMYLNLNDKTLVITATLYEDEFYALKDMDNLQKIVTPSFIENTVLDSGFYHTNKLDVKVDNSRYTLDMEYIEKQVIQDNICNVFSFDIDYTVDFDKVFIVDNGNERWTLHLPIIIDSADWMFINRETDKAAKRLMCGKDENSLEIVKTK